MFRPTSDDAGSSVITDETRVVNIKHRYADPSSSLPQISSSLHSSCVFKLAAVVTARANEQRATGITSDTPIAPSGRFCFLSYSHENGSQENKNKDKQKKKKNRNEKSFAANEVSFYFIFFRFISRSPITHTQPAQARRSCSRI